MKTQTTKHVATSASRRGKRGLTAEMGPAGMSRAESGREEIRQILRPEEATAPTTSLDTASASTPVASASDPRTTPEHGASVNAHADAARPVTPADVVRAGGRPLDPAVRASFEPRFSADLSDVVIHADDAAVASASALSARAYTLGNHVVFGAQAYQPATVAGRRLLAHELAHVVQQQRGGGGEVPTAPALSRSEVHEREASRAAAAIVHGGSAPRLRPAPAQIQCDRDGKGSTGSDEPTPVSISPDTPAGQLVALGGRLLRKSLSADDLGQVAHAVYLIVGGGVDWYDARGSLIDHFPIASDAPVWDEGVYVTYGAYAMQLQSVGRDFRWDQWFDFANNPLELTGGQAAARSSSSDGGGPDQSLDQVSRWLTRAARDRFAKIVAHQAADTPYLILIRPPSAGGGSGAAGEAAAERMADEVRRRLRDRAVASAGVAMSEAAPSSETASTVQPDPRIPDRLAVWSNERGVYVNVWADGAVEALPLADDATADQLDREVGDASERLRTSRDPTQSVAVADGAKRTGFVGKEDPDQIKIAGGKVANLPAYPSRIIHRGDDITVTGATQSFEMALDFSPAGGELLDQTLARLQTIHYRWELIDVTGVKPEDLGASAGTAVENAEDVSPLSGEAADISRDFAAVAEDTAADVDDTLSGDPLAVAATWPARSAWLTVVGVSNIVRMGGSLISSFIRVLSRPTNEESIGFSREGEFLVRCIATPYAGGRAEWTRGSSVAVAPIKVQNIGTRALAANQAALTQIKALEAERDRATGEDRARLDARIVALRRADTASVDQAGSEALKALDESIAAADEIEAANRQGTPREQRSPRARVLAVQLELQHVDVGEYRRELTRQRGEVQARLGLAARFAVRMPAGAYRPHITLASEETGQVIDVIAMLGEAHDSREGHRRYLLADLTSPSPRDRYEFEGRSSQAGVAGHREAVRNALVDFRENNGYGRGTIAIRLPEALETAAGGSLAIEATMRSAPGSRRRVMQRLSDLATAAEIAGLIVTGPAMIAVGTVAGVAGAIVSIDKLSRRREAGALHWDFETIMDIASIVGGAAGAATGPLHGLGKLPRWARRVERIQGVLHIIGITQLGTSAIAIPIQLEEQLTQIENTPNLSPGERAARRAEAFLGAVRAGVVTVVTVRQMMQPLGAGPEALADSEPLGPARSPVFEPGVEPSPPVREPAGAAEPSSAEPRPVDEPARAGRAAPSAPSPRIQALEPALGDLQGRVALVENPELHGRSARVRYGKDGVRIEIGTEVSPHEQIRAVERHLGTARTLLRFEGPLGAIRRLLSRIVQLLTRIPGYGTQGFESRLEVRKLSEIAGSLEQTMHGIEDRMVSLGDKDAVQLAREKAAIDRELEDIQHQLAVHEVMVDSLDPGVGHVAAYDARTIVNHPALRPQLDAIAARVKSTLGLDRGHIIDVMDLLQRQGRVRGLERWIEAAGAQATQPQFIQRIAELGNALLAAEALPPGHTLELVPSGASPADASFTTRTDATGSPTVRSAAETKARGALTRPGDPPDLAFAFDLWVIRERATGRDPDKTLSKIPEMALRNQLLRSVETLIEPARTQAVTFADLGDLLHPVLGKPEVEDNISMRYQSKPPLETERSHAKRVQTYHSEPVVIFGDTRSGMTYPAIDGTIGSPPRPMQLKTFGTVLEPYAARDAAMGALEAAKKFNVRQVEVYMEFDRLSMEQIEAGWDRPGGMSATQTPPGPVFEGDFIAVIEIKCSNGVVRVRFEGARYHFDRR